MTLLYFAYGSNLHPLRLAERAPSAAPVGRARLDDHALAFHKRGRDGSAKCDAVPVSGGIVHGALFEIASSDLAALDAAEQGYMRRPVRVVRPDGAQDAFTYRAEPDRIAAGLLPYDWYRDLVVAGARVHELPAAYVAGLVATRACDDPDAERGRRMAALVARLARS